MSKLWRLIATVSVLGLLAAACGDDGDTSTDQPTDEPAESRSDDAAVEPSAEPSEPADDDTEPSEPADDDTEAGSEPADDDTEAGSEPADDDTEAGSEPADDMSEAPSAEPAESKGTIKVGLLAPLTGGSAADGEFMLNGAQLAIDELNAAGGVSGYTIELVHADVEDLEPDKVATAVSRLIDNESVDLIVTGYASTTNFEIEDIAQTGIPYLIAGNSQQTADIVSQNPDAYGNVWSLTPTYDAYGTDLPVMLEDLIEAGEIDSGNRTVYFVTSDNPYSSGISAGLTATFESMGWTVVGEDTVPFGEISDWGSSVTAIAQHEPTIVVNTDFQVGNEATFLDQFLATSPSSLLFMQYGPSVPEFVELTRDASNGVLYNLLGGPIETSPRTIEIASRYQERFGASAGIYGIALYEEIFVWAAAVEAAGDPKDHAAVSAAIAVTDAEIASGRLVFDPETHLAIQGADYIPIQFFQIQAGGERPLIWPATVATGQYQAPGWLGGN